jgi:hypothetical protein
LLTPGEQLRRAILFLRSRYRDWLWAGPSGDRIPVEARFSLLVKTGPGGQPASYTMGTGSFPGIKRPGRGVDHAPPSSAEVKETVELYLYSSYWPYCLYRASVSVQGCTLLIFLNCSAKIETTRQLRLQLMPPGPHGMGGCMKTTAYLDY